MNSASVASPDFALWVYLSRTPLLWLTATLLVYAVADRVSAATGRHPLTNPVLHSVWALGLMLALTGTPYRTYFEGAQFVHFMLGPATVALAIPLWETRRQIARALVPMLAALAAGAVTALVSAVGIAMALGAPREALISIAPKSVTAGVAMGISETLGGDPALSAALVILTGILGALIVTRVIFMWVIDKGRASPTGARAASRLASPRTASAPRGRFRSTRPPARSPASLWASTRSSPR